MYLEYELGWIKENGFIYLMNKVLRQYRIQFLVLLLCIVFIQVCNEKDKGVSMIREYVVWQEGSLSIFKVVGNGSNIRKLSLLYRK